MPEPVQPAAGTAPGPGPDVLYALGSAPGEFPGLLATLLGLLDEAVKSLQEATAVAEKAAALPCHLPFPLLPGYRQKASPRPDRAQAIAGWLAEPRLLSRTGSAPAQWSLYRDGQDWLLHAGPEHARLRDSRGMQYLRALLASPGSDIPALDLAADGNGLAGSGTDPLLDAAARGAYRRRIRELDGELAAADRAGDISAAEHAHTEREALITQLRRAAGLAGRPRRAASETERARVNVTRTIRAAIDRITLAAPIAGTYLQSSIRTGAACRYQPAPGGPARWHT